MAATTSVTVSLGSTPVTYTVSPARTAEITTLTILRIVDLQGQKKVVVFTQEIPNPITIWSGASYDAVGDWTQAAAELQLIGIVNGTIAAPTA